MAVIWVVEDDAEQSVALKNVLTRLGHSARAFQLASEVLEAAVDELPDLFIVDLALPGGMNGLQLTQELIDGHGATPKKFLFLSAWAAQFREMTEDRLSDVPLVGKEEWSRTLLPTLKKLLSEQGNG